MIVLVTQMMIMINNSNINNSSNDDAQLQYKVGKPWGSRKNYVGKISCQNAKGKSPPKNKLRSLLLFALVSCPKLVCVLFFRYLVFFF